MPSAISTVPSVIGTTRIVVIARWYGDLTRILNAIGSAMPTLMMRDRQRKAQRGPDRRPQVVGGEEVRVVRERAALVRVERQR